PETFDGQELRSQRESLIRKALNQDYARELGKKFNLFHLKKDEEPSTGDMADLISRFEVVPAGPSTYLIGFFSSNPYVGFDIMKDFIAHVKSVLAQERHAKLVRLHDAIQDRLEVLSFGKGGGASPMMAKRPDLIKKEIDRIKEEITVLKGTYSDRHPKVTALTKRLVEISKLLDPSNENVRERSNPGIFSGAKVDDSSKELFQDLLKKFHYLEVVMFLDEQSIDTFLTTLQEPYVPSAPMWPKRPIILIWSIISGFLVGALVALVLEIVARRRSTVRPVGVVRSDSAATG
ncbi:MAG: hypothetical protein HY075_08595, partial [Deltaproteobacteria bacterium]|nr:hypothetical protein [Deltaproteobacteria bacterium]